MRGPRTVRTGLARRVVGDPCGEKFALKRRFDMHAFMVMGRRQRVDQIVVLSPRFATARGVRVGDTLADLRAAYGDSRVRVEWDEFSGTYWARVRHRGTWLNARLDPDAQVDPELVVLGVSRTRMQGFGGC